MAAPLLPGCAARAHRRRLGAPRGSTRAHDNVRQVMLSAGLSARGIAEPVERAPRPVGLRQRASSPSPMGDAACGALVSAYRRGRRRQPHATACSACTATCRSTACSARPPPARPMRWPCQKCMLALSAGYLQDALLSEEYGREQARAGGQHPYRPAQQSHGAQSQGASSAAQRLAWHRCGVTMYSPRNWTTA